MPYLPVRGGRIVIRTDADPAIGIGHVGRTLALAAAWRRRGGEVGFVAAPPLAPSAATWITSTGFPLDILTARRYSDADAEATAAIAGGATVVLDAFATPLPYRTTLRRQVRRLAIIDDIGDPGPWSADIILNQNCGASLAYYPGLDAGAIPLLGPGYALLRPEFEPWRAAPRRRGGAARRIAVSLGGTDPANAASLVLDAIGSRADRNWRTIIVAGPANPRGEALKDRAERGAGAAYVIRRPSSMARLLIWADIAILAGGVTVWEALSLGVPAIGITIADNQIPGAEALARDGFWHYLGRAETVMAGRIAEAIGGLLADNGERHRLSEAGRALVDGRGAERVAEALARL